MNFQPELAEKVMRGEKTVTRRLVSDKPRSPWWRERCSLKVDHTYAVCPGRGKHAIGRVRIVTVRHECLGALDDAEARREGFADGRAFVAAFEAINGCYADPEADVWRVEFEVVSSRAEVLVGPRDTQLEPDAGAQTRGEGVVQHDALTLEFGQDLFVRGHGAAGDVREAGRAAVLEVDAPPVAVSVGPGCLTGVGDLSDLHGGSVRASRTEPVGFARPCARLRAAAQQPRQTHDGELS